MRPAAFAALLRRLLWGAWTQNRGRLTLTVTAIALGVALASAVHLVNHSAAAEFTAAVRGLSGSADAVVRGARSGFDELLYPQLARRPEVAVASPVLELDAKLTAPVATTLRIQGIDSLRALELAPGLLGDARSRLIDLFLPDTVMLSLPAAQALGVGEGAVLLAQSGLRTVKLRVLAVLPLNDALRQPVALMDIAAAQWAFDRLGTITRIDLRLRRDVPADRALGAISADLPPGVEAAEVAIAAEQGLALSRAYRVNLNMLALVSLFTGAVLVYSTQALSVLRRRTHFALLRALGLARRSLAAWLAIEAIVLGIMGALAGIALGIVAAQLALARFGGDLGAGYFAGIVANLRPDAIGLAAIALCGVVASVLGGLVPAIEAARAEPAPALRSGAEPMQAPRPRWLPAACLLALAAASSLLPAVHGLPVFGYAALACLLSAALMLMPAYARAALGHLPLPAAATSRLAVQQLRAAPRYASISLAAILVALSLTVAMLVMIASFRQSLDTWLQAVLPADLYARGGSASSAWIDPPMQARMRSASLVERIAFSYFDSVRIDPGRPPVTLIARDLDPQRPEAVQWVSPQQLPADGTAPVWISEAARDLFGLKPGDRVRIPVAGRFLDATVAGIWRDYVRQSGALLIARADYLRAGGEPRANEAWIWLEPGADPDRAAARLRAELDLGPELELREPRLLRALSLATFDRTFAVTYALELVAVVIGLFGISVGASAQALARRRELGMLQHVGMARRDLRRTLAIEGAVVGALGAFAGIATGLVMSVILVHVINRQSFHWSMTMHIPWLPLVALALVLVACSAVTAALSVRSALGADIVRAVKEDW